LPVRVPPLRERKADILPLAQYFIDITGSDIVLNDTIKQAFLDYAWPGNVREMRNVIERYAVLGGNGETVFADALIQSGDNHQEVVVRANPDRVCALIEAHDGELKGLVRLVEKLYIEKVLDKCNWRITEAARILGLHRSMLYRKMQDYEIDKK
jgi:transcriptional regulator with PAS, ATPase and Fis domain